ncbi:uncharacterized protein PHALS_12256 [Plasmopara halstedii]|uniref:Uncharacterized protein n=1 Tax=Plasmopara halstedii TaxID=4781 RepID=A0A0P1AKZ4_PLAHL|nr:uncharacterized protein PHALS_12256 [Plasmopara halstedii]CEG41944.1 hypothetical protein PHALS_12256 [Plasmopara halstedii]|eukprot:XP_024578313.1 hypothetical protein PHALS_12256 [Plasmopara halstedii]
MVVIAPTPDIQLQRTSYDDLNAALVITQQPPDTWYKDQYGRKATFELKVERTMKFCTQCVRQRLLTVQLLYETGKVVEKQEILHIMSGQCLDTKNQSTLAMRIAEVSKNHLNRRFRIKLTAPTCTNNCKFETSVVSRPILVLSKKKKRPGKHNKETDTLSANAKKIKRMPKRRKSHDSLDTLETATIIDNVEVKLKPSLRTANATAPFTPETPNLSLWANAAFDLLYKLQWQRDVASKNDNRNAKLKDLLVTRLSRTYKCPSCLETYGQIPMHREDCDLKLLLEQNETETTTSDVVPKNLSSSHTLLWSSDALLNWPIQTKTLHTQTNVNKCILPPYQKEHEVIDIQAPVHKDILAASNASFHVHSWNDCASISKLFHSTSYGDIKPFKSESTPAVHRSGVLPPVSTLSCNFSSLCSATKMQQTDIDSSLPSQRLSVLLAVSKGLSVPAVDLFRESEAALRNDGSIVCSMSSMNLSEFFRPNLENQALNGMQFPLSAMLSPGGIENCEKNVQMVLVHDFQGCGFPALDIALNLVGFYQLLTETCIKPADLSFTPHIFSLPEEMLQELEGTIAEWTSNSTHCIQRDVTHNEAEVSLAKLKSAVLQRIRK